MRVRRLSPIRAMLVRAENEAADYRYAMRRALALLTNRDVAAGIRVLQNSLEVPVVKPKRVIPGGRP